jgi:hypothetical protein
LLASTPTCGITALTLGRLSMHQRLSQRERGIKRLVHERASHSSFEAH